MTAAGNAANGYPAATEPLSREEQLEQAILRIYRTQVYEEPGHRDRGLNIEFIAAINDAAHLVKTGEVERHDFGMLGICVRCGAEEREVNERIAHFKERKASVISRPLRLTAKQQHDAARFRETTT